VIALTVTRAGPLVTVQDAGRPAMLRHGISASGPMDRAAFMRAGARLGTTAGTGLEFSAMGLDFTVDAPVTMATAGGQFILRRNGEALPWEAVHLLAAGDTVSILPGPSGTYGYMRFGAEIAVSPVLGSRATNLVVGLGGLEGRALRAGDMLHLVPAASIPAIEPSPQPEPPAAFRVLWGLHADLFPAALRARFIDEPFTVSSRMDRMGVRLADPAGVFAQRPGLTLVSDAIVAGDIQILGDGTPIVLMRDHQPTGGYPRIATLISIDLDRFAQLRPGAQVRFVSISPQHAHGLCRNAP